MLLGIMLQGSSSLKSKMPNKVLAARDGDDEAEKDLALKYQGLLSHINATPLFYALRGLDNYETEKADRLVIIDFSLPSNVERFFVVNPQSGKLLYKKHVAHGMESGGLYATNFSNKKGSHKSSLGFYKIAETYIGKHGLSVRLDGLQPGLNASARERAVVIHQADYVDPDFLSQNGQLGRSWGCPALPTADYEDIVSEIANGALLLIYHPQLVGNAKVM